MIINLMSASSSGINPTMVIGQTIRQICWRIRRRCLPCVLLGAALGLQSAQADIDYPAQAKDLLYGEALFHYYQGQSFEALTLLNVAKERGGIKGHADHPLLVEGGLLLAYGMVNEAQSHFESVLAEELEARVPAGVRNQAWFYLGKVHYLAQDFSSAEAAFSRLDLEQLADDSPENAEELVYLRAQLKLKSPGVHDLNALGIDSFPENSLFSVYIRYNQALLTEPNQVNEVGSRESLEKLLASLKTLSLESDEDKRERDLLGDRIRLTLGQLYLEGKDYSQAAGHLKKVSFDSPFSEQALFNYAVAMAHNKEYSLALSALNRLRDTYLFTPWLQQVPYALAYLYEQMGEPSLALQAYQSAGAHYDLQLEQLLQQQSELNEEKLLLAIATPNVEADASALIDDDQTNETVMGSRELQLGAGHVENDAYGRINVYPSDFSIAELLSGERFQWGLRDLHELYKLGDSLSVWDKRLASFELMLETRETQRNERLRVVEKELEAQQAAHWIEQQSAYEKVINAALAEENIEFFMDEAQMEFAQQIRNVRQTLSVLPNDEDKIEYEQKLSKIEGYFTWWIADRYGVNRWAAQSELKQLGRSMEEFVLRHAKLKSELANNSFQHALVARVDSAKSRLTEIRQQLALGLANVRERLLAQVREELERQSVEVSRYRLASRHAQARIADSIYRDDQELPVGEESSPNISLPPAQSKAEAQSADSALEEAP